MRERFAARQLGRDRLARDRYVVQRELAVALREVGLGEQQLAAVRGQERPIARDHPADVLDQHGDHHEVVLDALGVVAPDQVLLIGARARQAEVEHLDPGEPPLHDRFRYADVVERLLPGVEVYNFGLPGAGPTSSTSSTASTRRTSSTTSS